MQPAAQRSEVQRLVDQAVDLAEGGSMDAAITLFQQAVQLEPGSGAAHDMLAQCCMEAGQHEAAYSAACTACRLLPTSAGALLTLGRAARNTGRLKEAAAAFEGALAAQPADGVGPDPGLEGVLAELMEVRELRQLEVGHVIGLPGLRISEAATDSQLGPGGVVWESGALLARLLVTCSQAEAGKVGHACTAACSSGVGGCCMAHAGGRAASSSAEAGAPLVPGSASVTAAPLPGVPTFAMPREAAAPCGANATSGAPLSAGSFLAGAHVLELGSGTGVVGISAGCLGAHVVATDLLQLLPLLRGNISLNAAMIEAARGSVAAAPLDWEAEPAGWGGARERAEGAGVGVLAGRPPPGWIMGADLVYSLAPVAALVRALAALVKEAAAGDCGIGQGASANPCTLDGEWAAGDRKLLLAHKRRHEEVDAALLEGLKQAGVPLRVVARDPGSRVTVYANAPAAAALGL